jgi:hypothetical protein
MVEALLLVMLWDRIGIEAILWYMVVTYLADIETILWVIVYFNIKISLFTGGIGAKNLHTW